MCGGGGLSPLPFPYMRVPRANRATRAKEISAASWRVVDNERMAACAGGWRRSVAPCQRQRRRPIFVKIGAVARGIRMARRSDAIHRLFTTVEAGIAVGETRIGESVAERFALCRVCGMALSQGPPAPFCLAQQDRGNRVTDGPAQTLAIPSPSPSFSAGRGCAADPRHG